tara:strand:- start:453 stop:647 length:195 start_codon:yes stop_codon:yes gene_type:complete
MAHLIKEKPNNWYKKPKEKENITLRKCLPCGKMFDSWGPGNRICKECKTSSAYKDYYPTTSIKM